MRRSRLLLLLLPRDPASCWKGKGEKSVRGRRGPPQGMGSRRQGRCQGPREQPRSIHAVIGGAGAWGGAPSGARSWRKCAGAGARLVAGHVVPAGGFRGSSVLQSSPSPGEDAGTHGARSGTAGVNPAAPKRRVARPAPRRGWHQHPPSHRPASATFRQAPNFPPGLKGARTAPSLGGDPWRGRGDPWRGPRAGNLGTSREQREPDSSSSHLLPEEPQCIPVRPPPGRRGQSQGDRSGHKGRPPGGPRRAHQGSLCAPGSALITSPPRLGASRCERGSARQ